MRTISALAAASILSVLAGASPGVAGADQNAGGTPIDCVTPQTDDRCERWAHRYTKGEGEAPFGRHQSQMALTGAISPSGKRAFAIGYRTDIPGGKFRWEMQTVAYDASTGNLLWAATETGPTEEWTAFGRTVVVGRDEKVVYAIGTVFLGSGSAKDKERDVLIAAYDAATGARIWRATYDGPARAQDDALAAAVSPVDDRLYVAASSTGTDLPVRGGSPMSGTRGPSVAGLEVDTDFALLTYDASTGDLLDEDRYAGSTFTIDGVAHASWDIATDILVSQDGQRIVMAGATSGRESYRQSGMPQVTVLTWVPGAGENAQGWEILWARELPGAPIGLGIFPAQGMVALAGAFGQGGTEFNPYAIVGLDGSTGGTRWQTRFALGGINSQLEYPRRLLADPSSGLIHLPGISRYSTSSYGTMGVLSLRAADGSLAWRKRLRDPMSNATIIFNYDIDEMPVGAVDLASGHVHVTSNRGGYLQTFSLNGSTGDQRWAGLFEKPLRPGTKLEQSGADWPVEMAAAAGTAVVFGNSYVPYRDSCPGGVLGSSPCSRDDFLTIAYEV